MSTAVVEWAEDGQSVRIVLPAIKAHDTQEARVIAERMIWDAANEAGIPVAAIDIENILDLT